MESNLHKNVTEQKIIPEIRFEADKNTYALRNIAQIDGNYEKNMQDFIAYRKLQKECIPWPIKNLACVKLIMRDRFFSPICLIYVDKVDIKSNQRFPIMVSYLTILPKIIARDIACSYKGVWLSSDITDPILGEMVYDLNNEHPMLDGLFREFFTGEKEKDTFPFLYEDYEEIREGRKKTKIQITQTLHEPLQVKTIENEDGEQQTIMMLSQFLQPEKDKFEGVRSPGLVLEIFEESYLALQKYIVKSEAEQTQELQAEKEAKIQQESQELNKCPKCGWLLSSGKTKCPMCGTDQLNVKQDDFVASLALKDSDKMAKTEMLMGSLDNLLGNMDEETEKAQNLFHNSITTMIKEDTVAAPLITQINQDGDSIQESYGILLKSLQEDLTFELKPFKFIEIGIQELSFPWTIFVESLIKEDYSDYHVPVVSYMTICPALPGTISLIAYYDEDSDTKRFKWQTTGDDLGLCDKLNSPQFMEFVKEVFGNENQKYASHFQAKKKDPIGRIVEVEGMEYELPFMISVRPFAAGIEGPEGKNVFIMHHFIKSEVEGYPGTIPFNKTLVLMDAIIAGIELVLNPRTSTPETQNDLEAQETQESKSEPSSPLGFDLDEEDGESEFEEFGGFEDTNESDNTSSDGFEFDWDADSSETPEVSSSETSFDSTFDNSFQQPSPTTTMPVTPQTMPQINPSLSPTPPTLTPPTLTPTPAPALSTTPIPKINPTPNLGSAQAKLEVEAQALGLDPKMNVEQIDQKAQEIAYQMQSMDEMEQQLNQAFMSHQITSEQYTERNTQLQQYKSNFNKSIQVLQMLRRIRLSN